MLTASIDQTEDAIITAIEKTCGGHGQPVPFRGAYLLEEAEDCEKRPLPGCGHKGFSLRRRIPMLPPSIVPTNWRTDAMKFACTVSPPPSHRHATRNTHHMAP